MNILMTGGAGYIGSHTCVEFLENGYDLVVYDNLSNSSIEAIKRVEKITNKSIRFIEGDILDIGKLDEVFNEQKFDAVIHFAGLKSVGESGERPLSYYDNNVVGTINLLKIMQKYSINNLVFSSSATVYGIPKTLPLDETAPRSTTNPYGTSKLIIEYILEDVVNSNKDFKVVNLRYFNPVGAHRSGLIGEDPNGKPNNLFPFISQVAIGKREILSVFGGDYNTKDGTGVRDYIHVVDLAKGHVRALNYLESSSLGEFLPINLGTGKGYSVLEMIEFFSKVSNKSIPYEIVKRRQGDVAECFGDVRLALEKLKWKAELGLKEMCEDTWNWQVKNPNGYKIN